MPLNFSLDHLILIGLISLGGCQEKKKYIRENTIRKSVIILDWKKWLTCGYDFMQVN